MRSIFFLAIYLIFVKKKWTYFECDRLCYNGDIINFVYVIELSNFLHLNDKRLTLSIQTKELYAFNYFVKVLCLKKVRSF